MSTLNRIFLALAIVIVVAVIAIGFLKIGTPAQNRLIALDNHRLSDLSAIANGAYSAKNRTVSSTLPSSLEALAKASPYYANLIAIDPNGVPYIYRVTSSSTFQLCATFDTEQKAVVAGGYQMPNNYSFWDHPKGDHCFEFTTNDYPPYFYENYYPSSPSPSLFGL